MFPNIWLICLLESIFIPFSIQDTPRRDVSQNVVNPLNYWKASSYHFSIQDTSTPLQDVSKNVVNPLTGKHPHTIFYM